MAVGMLATVTLVPLVVSMVLSDGRLHELTMKMLDTFTSIFLAILWFNTFRQFLETFDVVKFFPGAREVFLFLQILVLYIIAMVVAWLWRDSKMRVTTFCSCGAHFIAFAGISAGAQGQSAVSRSASDSFDSVAVFSFCFVVGGFLAVMFIGNYYLWRRNSENEKLNEAVEELELDVVGLVISFVVTQSIRHALTGQYPAPHLLQLGLNSNLESHLDVALAGHLHHIEHRMWQRLFMLGWATGLAALATFTLPKLNHWARSSSCPGASQWVHVLKVVLIMLIAWGYLLWGQWEFEHLFEGHGLFSQMVFAMLATLVCLAILILMAKFGQVATTPEAQETYNIITTGVSLVAAWSWEHCFNAAFDIIGDEYEVGYDGLVPKLVLSVVVPAALLPTYVSHVRPRVLEIEESHGHAHAHEHEHGGHEEEEHLEKGHAH